MLLWIGLACSAGGEGASDGDTAAEDTAAEDTATEDTADDTAAEDTADDTGGDEHLPAFTYLYGALGTSCGVCHYSDYIGPFFVEGNPEATHDRLLTLVPLGDPDARYVVPGDADASLLLHKVGDAPPFGGSMPPPDSGVEPLDSSMVEALRIWIDGGAPLTDG